MKSSVFRTTRWSVVLAARDPAHAREALETLCQGYWYPLYAFVRRHGYSPQDSEDLVQEFFARCLEKQYLEAADHNRGRFRSFLLTAFKRFLANEWDKTQTLRRGGSQRVVSLDAMSAEQRYAAEPADTMSAEKLYERRWALTLLENVLNRLRVEQTAGGRSDQFELLQEFLLSRARGTPYAELARRLALSEGAVKVAVHRLRQRYRQLLEEEISQTVAAPDDIQTERRHLLDALGAK